MSLLPEITDLILDLDIAETPTTTFQVDLKTGRIGKVIDGVEAVKQTVYFMLNCERYKYPIYSWNYGVEFEEFLGSPTYWVNSVIENRIKEVLLSDERITNVRDFKTSEKRGILSVSFTVDTIYGEFDDELEVSI